MFNLLSFASVMSTIGSVLLAILILLIMITIHEFGHYIVGKILKFKINEFAIGMGPAIFKKTNKKSGEIFSIRIFPLGGFCAFAGEDKDEQEEGDFNSKAPWKRILVLVAGATMNFILGTLILVFSVSAYGQILVRGNEIHTVSGYENTLEAGDTILKINSKNIYMVSDIPDALSKSKKGDTLSVCVIDKDGNEKTRKVVLAYDPNVDSLTDTFSAMQSLGIGTILCVEDAGGNVFKDGDYILRINDNETYENCTRIYDKDQLIEYIQTKSNGDEIEIYVLRGEEKVVVTLPINFDPEQFKGNNLLEQIGVNESSLYLNAASVNVKFSFWTGIKRGFEYSLNTCTTIFKILGQLLTGKIGVDSLGGPITTITTTTTAIKTGGLNYFFEIAGYIGINLAIFNLLPIPALDGSRVVFCVIEWIRKKPVNRKVEAVIHGVGLLLLLGFCVLVDILQIF